LNLSSPEIYMNFLIEVSVVSYGLKDNSQDMITTKINPWDLMNGLLSLTNPDSTPLLKN
jgi:hypothetical protein